MYEMGVAHHARKGDGGYAGLIAFNDLNGPLQHACDMC